MEPVPDWGTIPRMLRAQAARLPDVEVVSDGPVRLTLASLRTAVAEAARGLLALGVCRGDRVALWGRNDWRWVVLAFAVWDTGGIVVPLSTRYKGIEACELLRKTGASVIWIDEGFLDVSADLLPTDIPIRVVTPSSWDAFIGDGTRVDDAALEERALAVRPDDVCEIMSTSGTTGSPKGVMLIHSANLRAYWDWSEIVTLRRGDRYPVIAPFAHGFGLNAGLLACVMRGATMMPIGIFTPDGLMDLIVKDRISILAGPPNLFYRLLDELDLVEPDVSVLRVAICGAAAVPAELIHRLLDRVGLNRMINAYGLMEGTVVSMTRASDPLEVIASSTGRPVPGVSVKIVDDAGEEVATGDRGEILVGGYGVMKGYWAESARTAEVIQDGWLHTGDVGTLDGAGNLAIVDRKKELFIVGGFNVSPAEVERLLLREGSLAQAAVIGVPVERQGEVGWAFVVPRPGVVVDASALVAWARDNMSNYKVPRKVVVVDALPVNANGKVDKIALRAQSWS